MHYSGSVVRPPHEANSILLEVTVGCSHNKCAFCHYYRDDRFRIAPLEQVEADLAEVRSVVPHAHRVFVLGADAFVLSFDKLKRVAELIRAYLPRASIGMYARITNLYSKTVEELKQLRELGVNDIVIGMETGAEDLLTRVNKGYTAADIVEQCAKLEQAGIEYRILYLGALGGHGSGERNAVESARVLNRIHPTHLMLASLTLMPGTDLHQDALAGRFVEASERERLWETLTLVRNLENEIIVLGNHVSNAVPFIAHLPRDKETLMAMLEDVLERLDEDALRARRDNLVVI